MPESPARETGRDGRVAAWDPAVRVLHWSLAALALLAGGTASFATLRPSLRDTLSYLRLGAPRTPGHDPLGVWMIWLLWSLVLLLGVTGWMSRLDAFWGDDGIRAIHAWFAHALLI